MTDEEIKNFIVRKTVDVVVEIIKSHTFALFAGEDKNGKKKDEHKESSHFVRHVLSNIIGNMILEMSDSKKENAFELNFQSFLKELQLWFDLYKKNLSKDMH